MYGGGFAKGHTAEYDGGKLVARSVELKTPVIYVSMNYRSVFPHELVNSIGSSNS